MVSVKRGGKWVKLQPGQSIGNVSVPRKTAPNKPGQPIYIDIDDISVQKSPTGGPTKIDIKPEAPVYQRDRTGSSFRQVAKINQFGSINPTNLQPKVQGPNQVITTTKRGRIEQFTKVQLARLQRDLATRKKNIEARTLKAEQDKLRLRAEQIRRSSINEKPFVKINRSLSKMGASTIQSVGNGILGFYFLGESLVGGTKFIAVSLKNLPSEQRKLIDAYKKDPELVKQVTSNEAKRIIKKVENIPEATVKAGKFVGKAGKDYALLARYSPAEVVGQLGTDILFFAGSGKGLRIVGKATNKGKNQIKKLLPNKINNVGSTTKLTGRTVSNVRVGNSGYGKIIDAVEEQAENIGRSRGRTVIANLEKQGIKLDKRRQQEFLDKYIDLTKKQLNNLDDFKKLKRVAKLNKPDIIRLIKQNKLLVAPKLKKQLLKQVSKTKIGKKSISGLLKVKKATKKVKKFRSSIKEGQKSAIEKFKSDQQVKKQLQRARRKLRSKKTISKTLNFGNNDFAEAIALVDNFFERFIELRVKKTIALAKKKGTKIGLGKEEEIIRNVKILGMKRLRNLPDYKTLEKAVRYEKPFAIKLIKNKKLASAKVLAKNILDKQIKKINNAIIKTNIGREIKKIIPLTKKIRRERRTQLTNFRKRLDNSKKLKSQIKKNNKAVKAQRKRSRKTPLKTLRQTRRAFISKRNKALGDFRRSLGKRYKLTNSRPLRKVTLEQLQRSQTVSDTNKLIDKFFDEMARRQSIDVTALQYRQAKNTLKKRVAKAIRRGDKQEIEKFKQTMIKMHKQMNQKSNLPDVKVSEVGKVKKRIQTIKDFETDVPKGSYVEVKQGQQILVQRLKDPVQKTKIKSAQKFKVERVIKKKISLRPIVEYGVYSLSKEALTKLRTASVASAQVNGPRIRSAFAPSSDVNQDFKVFQGFATASGTGVNIASAVAQSIKPKLKSSTRQRSISQKEKKKRIPRFELSKTKRRLKSVSSKAFNVYAKPIKTLSGKKATRMIKVNSKPLSEIQARNLRNYIVDTSLSRTAKIVPTSGKPSSSRLNIPSNYASLTSSKFREYAIKLGKRRTLPRGRVIEKRKNSLDTRGEKKGITLRRRIKQINAPRKTKSKRKK